MDRPDALHWLWHVTGRKKLFIAVLIILQALSGGSGVLYALLLRDIVDSAVKGETESFRIAAILTVLLVAGQIFLRTLIRYFEELCRSSVENSLKSRLLHAILTQDYAAVSAVHSGEWLNRLTSDSNVVANYFTEILPGLSGMIVKLISAAAMLVILDSRFAVVMLPAGVLMLAFTCFFRRRLKTLHKKVQEKDGNLRIFLQERLGAQILLRSYAAESYTESEAADKMSAHKDARMKKNRFSNICNIGFMGCIQGMYLAGICYCAYGILIHTISYGTLTAVTQLIGQIQTPFANITGYLPRYYAMTASAERLADAEFFVSESMKNAKPLSEIQSAYGNMQAVGLRGVRYSYLPVSNHVEIQQGTEMPVVFSGLSFEVKKGEFVALTGHSGCGKSTLLKLLMCVYRPEEGACYLRNTKGNESEIDSQWRRLFAYVPQGNQLMSGSIRDVIAFSDPESSSDHERLQFALRTACAEEFVNALEMGADTLLGERGAGLSEGQMQRIAIARAVFSGSPVLILDEATSALDIETEKRVLSNLRRMTDRTVLIVTHRPAALEYCDRVIRFEEQRMTEETQMKEDQNAI